MELRPYQVRALEETVANLSENPVLVMPTGSGKTYTAAEVVRCFGRRVLWLAHRTELVQQAAGQLAALGLQVGIIQAGFQEKRWQPVQVASVQTLVRRMNLLPPSELIVVDEAHHVSPGSSYHRILDAYAGRPRVGLTATPFRLDGRGLGGVFGRLVVAARARELCDNGTLIAPVVFAPAAPAMKGVQIRAGEFNMEQAARKMDTPKLTGNIVTTWLKHANGRRTVCFAVNVAHSKHITDRFREAGVPAEHLDGTMAAIDRIRILGRLRNGETQVLSNCMVITEGFDLPALEVAILARPTASLGLHLQALGRIMRAAHGKEGGLVLDHAGNHHRHGMVTDDIEYSLDDDVRARPKREPGEAVVRTCPKCSLVCGAGCSSCPECGHLFEVKTEIPDEAPGELVPFGVRAALFEQWDAQASAYGFRDGYAHARYRQQFGEFPLTLNGKLVAEATPDVEVGELRRLVVIAKHKGFKPGWSLHMWRSRFGRWPNKAQREAAGWTSAAPAGGGGA